MAEKLLKQNTQPAPTVPTQDTGGGTTKLTIGDQTAPGGRAQIPGIGRQTVAGGKVQLQRPSQPAPLQVANRASGGTTTPDPGVPNAPDHMTQPATPNAASGSAMSSGDVRGQMNYGSSAPQTDTASSASEADIRAAMNYASNAARTSAGTQNFNPEQWVADAEAGRDMGNGVSGGKSYYALENTGYDPGEGYDYTDWSKGTMTTRPEGGYTVYDGKGNRMGHYDSAGQWHNDISDTELAESWNKYGQQLIDQEGIQFTGDGTDRTFGRDDWTGGRGDGIGPWTKQRTHEQGMAEAIRGLYGDDTVFLRDEDLRNGGVTLEPGKSYLTESDYYNYIANRMRPGQGNSYSTGTPTPDPGVPRAPTDGSGSGGYSSEGFSGLNIPETPDLKPLLEQWKQAAEEQQQGRIDYAVQQGIDELTRAQEDAQKGFQTAQEQISAEEAINKDNQALYAEARGDKGGIGAAQYDSIMNTAAQNRQQVREQQTQLATDTARQIADLRSKGEFEKADAVLQLSQEYLSNLMNLEQWAANYGLSAAQFAESVREWENNYKLSVANITGYLNGQRTLAGQEADRNFALNEAGVTGLYNGRQTRQALNDDRNFRLNEAGVTGYYGGKRTLAGENADRNFGLSEAGITGYYNGQPTYQNTSSQQNLLSSAGNALLSAGIMPSEDQLRAMGLSSEQAQALLMAAQAKASAKGGSGYSTGNRDAYAALSAAGVKTEGEAYNLLRSMGYKDGDAKTFAGYYMADAEARKPTAEMEDLVDWLSNLNKTSPDVTPENKVDMFERAAKYNGWSEDQILWVAQQLGML